jgi:hypothetical protein
MTTPTHAYIGFRPCGCRRAFAFDLGDKRTREMVADIVGSGLAIERMAITDDRCNLSECDEHKEKATA